MRLTPFLLAPALLLCSCPTNRNLTRIYMGMSYDELLSKVGQPTMKTVMDSATTVYYFTFRSAEALGNSDNQYYCVEVGKSGVQRHGPCPARK